MNNNLFEAWRTARPPYYEKKYKENLLKEFTDYGAKTQDIKAFETAYEFYIYAFFIGLYNEEKKEITKKENSYGYQIEFWGNKSNKRGRKDFAILQKYIFVALVAKTDVDFISLEKGEITEESVVNELMETMEKYANGGMRLIREKSEENESYFYSPTGFLEFMIQSKNKI